MDKGGRSIIIVIAVIAVLAIIAYALGLFNVDASGELKTPQVSVSGGEIPELQLETADIDVGTKEVTVDVPTMDVTPAGDDGSANQ